MYNTYLLNYDPLMIDPSPQRLVEFVRSNSYTYQYFFPFGGSLLIKSTANRGEMYASYSPFLQPNGFILTLVDSTQMSGALYGEHWDWLNSKSPPPLLTAS